MQNYLVSYDLNGPNPTHRDVDAYMRASGVRIGRVLETVWYVKTSSILSSNDRLIVVEAGGLRYRNLLVDPRQFEQAYNKAA